MRKCMRTDFLSREAADHLYQRMSEMGRVMRFICPPPFNVVVAGTGVDFVRWRDLRASTNHICFVREKQKPYRGPSRMYFIFLEQIQHSRNRLPRPKNIGTVARDA